MRLPIAVSLLTLAMITPASADELRDGFDNPPQSARPRVWWHWMNGNVTVDGIDKDLDWMARVGIGGVQNFDANLMTPQIVAKRLVYMEPDWKIAFRHAVERAEAKGLEFAIAASPGWSETGGPWVKPEDGMKKLVWSETVVAGGARLKGKIAPAPSVTGPFQTARFFDPLAAMSAGGGKPPAQQQASGEIAILAVPVAAAKLPVPHASTSAASTLNMAPLIDDDLETTVSVPKGDAAAPGALTLSYPEPVTVRSARLFVPHAKPPFGDAPYRPVLEAEMTGGWQRVGEFSLGDAATTIGFAPVTAKRFRIVIAPNRGARSIGLGAGAPGAMMFDIFGADKSPTLAIGALSLSGEAAIDRAEDKGGFSIVPDYDAIVSTYTGAGTALDRVIDLTTRLRADGTLDWTAPKGQAWRVLRFGWSLTGKKNHPATEEATGLEVDKYDAAAVRRYLETYLGMYRDTVGADLIGKRGIRALLTDSIEVGASNWTPRMLAEFKARRGYDALRWLPALAGVVVGSAAESEKFLSDYRRTLADLIADAHYGTVAKVAHEHGLTVYGEALEDGRPVLGDDMAMRRHADVPMAALWTFDRATGPRPTLLGDMRGAASVAHVYGQNIVAAESMTSAFSPWAFAPADLKRIIDLEFASGINRPVIHTSVHQPSDDKQPGLSLMIFGQYFNRHETWAEMAKPWVDYLARSSFMLQQGRNHADIAYFYGEDAPLTAQFKQAALPDLPTRYAYDFVNADVLANELSVTDGALTAKSGARYRMLYLGTGAKRMTLATLRRIAALAEAGATVVGSRPAGTPSLADDAKAFDALAARLWGSSQTTRVGTGRVIASNIVESGLEDPIVSPDFAMEGGNADLLFVHRILPDGEIYFVNNRRNAPRKGGARFRVAGKIPELWRATTGKIEPLSYRPDGDATVVSLDLLPDDAVFVVFRKSAPAGMASDAPSTALREAGVVGGKWTLAFQPDRGAPAGLSMAALTPLNASADPGIRYFSGITTYTSSFRVPGGMRAAQPIALDLGQVGDVAEVRVNGMLAGTVWTAPYRVEIGPLVRIGANTVEVRVANLWVNRLIGDMQPGATKVTFTAAPTYLPNAPLRPAGLIGPVRLMVKDVR
jgi:alpha-L-rhamnosidase